LAAVIGEAFRRPRAAGPIGGSSGRESARPRTKSARRGHGRSTRPRRRGPRGAGRGAGCPARPTRV